MCDCIKVTYQLIGEEPITVEVKSSGILNGKPYYEIVIIEGESPSVLAWDNTGEHPDSWELDSDNIPYLNEDTPCPFGVYTIEEGSIFEAFEVSECTPPLSCDCISVTYQLIGEEPVTVEVGGAIGEDYWEFNIFGILPEFSIFTIDKNVNFDEPLGYVENWTVQQEASTVEDGTVLQFNEDTECPFGNYEHIFGPVIFESFVVSECIL